MIARYYIFHFLSLSRLDEFVTCFLPNNLIDVNKQVLLAPESRITYFNKGIILAMILKVPTSVANIIFSFIFYSLIIFKIE